MKCRFHQGLSFPKAGLFGPVQDDSKWMTARSGLEAAVSSGQMGVRLSATHYLELWHRREERSREEVGTVMRDVMGYATIPSTHSLRRREVRALVSQLAGRSLPLLSTSDLLGHGAAHAFDSPRGRFRFIEALASPDGKVNEGPATGPPENWNTLARTGQKWDWPQLVGTPVILESEGVELTELVTWRVSSCSGSTSSVNPKRVGNYGTISWLANSTPCGTT